MRACASVRRCAGAHVRVSVLRVRVRVIVFAHILPCAHERLCVWLSVCCSVLVCGFVCMSDPLFCGSVGVCVCAQVVPGVFVSTMSLLPACVRPYVFGWLSACLCVC